MNPDGRQLLREDRRVQNVPSGDPEVTTLPKATPASNNKTEGVSLWSVRVAARGCWLEKLLTSSAPRVVG